MRYLMIFGFIIGAMTTIACEKRQPRAQVAKVLDQGTRESELIRYEDKELGVMCYRVRGYEGFSCLRKSSLQQEQVQQ